MIPTLAAVIAMIVGHPVPVKCTQIPPPQPGFTELGVTYFNTAGPTRIELQTFVCNEWNGVQGWPTPADYPGEYAIEDVAAGGALLTAIHEAEHYRYATTDEAVTECRALRDYRSILDRVFPTGPIRWQAPNVRKLLLQGARARRCSDACGLSRSGLLGQRHDYVLNRDHQQAVTAGRVRRGLNDR